MNQKLELYSNDKMLVRTTSPEMLIDLASGGYAVTVELRDQLSALWPMDEYEGELTLEVTNG